MNTAGGNTPLIDLVCGQVHCIPIIHGRLAFALEVRRRLLEQRYAAVAVELPEALGDVVREAVAGLPRISVVTYRETPAFLQPDAVVYYVPIQPGDAIVEAVRIVERERTPCYFIDADLNDPQARGVRLPDPYTLHTLGMQAYYDACLPALAVHPHSSTDIARERHMAARLREICAKHDGPVLFVCGMAHWRGVRALLEGTEALQADSAGFHEDLATFVPDSRSIAHMLGELPFLVTRYEQHRAGFELDDFDAVQALRELLLRARERHAADFPGSLERPDPHSLRTLLAYARKMTVRRGYLIPDMYTLTVAAHGVVGNDFAISVLRTANEYPWAPERQDPPEGDDGSAGDSEFAGEDEFDDASNLSGASGDGSEAGAGSASGPQEPVVGMGAEYADLGNGPVPMQNRYPGTAFTYGRLRLEERVDPRRQRDFRQQWDPSRQCSWPPEDVVIEDFRDYVGKRALSLAKVARTHSEPFTTSYLDGLDIRATLRDVVERRLFVKEEPRTPGAVGALVLIFEEDDFGERYPWRSTWMAEHHNESTLSFYATNYMDGLIGPGIARAHYGGCSLIYPPVGIPDIWGDFRFERARTPSERLLLAAIYWAQDYYVVHVGNKPPAPEVQQEAQRRKKHVLHLPLSTFSTRTLERLRRFHVLNGQEVRSWAQGFIR
ncbi:MAG: hypothetical protein AAF581_02190 [Planctomycetota bacterium]